MSINYCVASPNFKGPIGFYPSQDAATEALPSLVTEYPGSTVMTSAEYWKMDRARALAKFPLSEVTEEFFYDMLNCLPPLHRAGCPGFFVSEAETDSVHAQFFEHNGRYYGGFADIAPDGRTWTYADAAAIAADPRRPTPLTWYPKEGDI